MYIPPLFRVDDREIITAFMQQFDFAAIVTHSAERGFAVSHVPVLIREVDGQQEIVGHVARSNSHWQLMDGQSESLAIFHGPHGYVSPTWYTSRREVPTWNYAVVHAYGPARAVDDAGFVDAVIDGLTRRYEEARSDGWSPREIAPDAHARLVKAVVGFAMPIVRCEAKFKLGQNRSVGDRRGAIAGLERETTAGARELAEFMKRYCGDS